MIAVTSGIETRADLASVIASSIVDAGLPSSSTTHAAMSVAVALSRSVLRSCPYSANSNAPTSRTRTFSPSTSTTVFLSRARSSSFVLSTNASYVEAKTIDRARSGNQRWPNPDNLAADLQRVSQHRTFADRTRNVPGANGRAELEVFRWTRVLPRDADRD